jgi:hypothetical protein
MKINFANAEVDVWKLRKGVVLAYEHGGVNYAHLSSFYQVHGADNFFIIEIDEWGNTSEFKSDALIWLEPHD